MKILKLLFSRMVFVGLLIVIQVIWLVNVIVEISYISKIINDLFIVVSVLVVLSVINTRENPAYKLAWVVPILLFPIIGGVLYLLVGRRRMPKELKMQLEDNNEYSKPYVNQDEAIEKELEWLDKSVYNQSKYIANTLTPFPIYKNTMTQYFKVGEEYYEALIEELEKAKHFIFMEYFIIAEGTMWNTILGILKRKVKAGVEVKLLYDDVGSLTLLPYEYYKELEEYGIQCEAFNHFKPTISIAMNHRDHRKITVIDGYIGFTGGINLADEYINQLERFGHWKDSGVLLKGDAVWNLTVMFLQMWNTIRPVTEDYMKYTPSTYCKEKFPTDGFVQPYADSPFDDETVGENVYLNMINAAKDYVYIFTPYLIIDNEMMTALCLSAKRGVDVRIVTPNTPDKKLVFLLTQSYYPQLIESGVKIYQYAPGFLHSKSFVCDDEVAVVGTINLDFRSLYLHFECGVFMYRSSVVMKVKEDFMETIKICISITKEKCEKRGILKTMQEILKLFAPIM